MYGIKLIYRNHFNRGLINVQIHLFSWDYPTIEIQKKRKNKAQKEFVSHETHESITPFLIFYITYYYDSPLTGFRYILGCINIENAFTKAIV